MSSPSPTRLNYRLALPAAPALLHSFAPTGGALRNPLPEETELLAELMLDADRGTADDAGETTDDALAEVEGYFAGRAGEPLLDCSWVYDNNGTLLAACLISDHGGEPLVAYLMTRSPWKGRGLASYLLRQAILSLQDARRTSLVAVVTAGNLESEAMMAHFGFVREAV
ncbi:MAG: GNAT family N-acetyltransferase [Caldilineaceae bacterium]